MTQTETSDQELYSAILAVDSVASPEFGPRMLALGLPILAAYFAYDFIYPVVWFLAYASALIVFNQVARRLNQRVTRSQFRWMVAMNFLATTIFVSLPCMLWLEETLLHRSAAIGLSLGAIMYSVGQRTQLPAFALGDAVANSSFFALVAVTLVMELSATIDRLIIVLLMSAMTFYYFAALLSAFRVRASLRNANERSSESKKMEAIGRLTGGVAHDFNNILTVVLGNLELYRELDDVREKDQLAEEAHDAAKRASVLTSQLLAFSRRATLLPRAIRLDQFVDDFWSMTKRVMPETIDFSTEIEPDLWPVLADKTQFESALLNLAINARDAMPNGGTLHISAKPWTVHLKSGKTPLGLSPGKYVRITVSDTGRGISRSVKDRVFEPFYTTKAIGQGSGLGLSMAKGFAEQSHGMLTLESELNKGTHVQLTLPAAMHEVMRAKDAATETESRAVNIIG